MFKQTIALSMPADLLDYLDAEVLRRNGPRILPPPELTPEHHRKAAAMPKGAAVVYLTTQKKLLEDQHRQAQYLRKQQPRISRTGIIIEMLRQAQQANTKL